MSFKDVTACPSPWGWILHSHSFPTEPRFAPIPAKPHFPLSRSPKFLTTHFQAVFSYSSFPLLLAGSASEIQNSNHSFVNILLIKCPG